MARATRRMQFLSGVALILAGVVALWAAAAAFQGNFGSHIQVTANVQNVGDSLRTGDDVVYRDIIVGSVTGSHFTDGHASLTLKVDSDEASAIPGNVTAIAVPTDVFGATQVVLIPPAVASGELTSGATVQANHGPAAVGLQSALADAYSLIAAIQPAQLGSALTALGSAADGRGREWNQLLKQANSVLKTVVAQAPELQVTMVHLATVSKALSEATPNALQTLNNLLGPMTAVIQEQHALAQLMGVSALAADGVEKILGPNAAKIMNVVNTEEPFLGVLAASPQLAGSLITGLQEAAAKVNSIAPGGRAKIFAVISGVNIEAAVQSLAGMPSEAVGSSADPPLYTAADCPQYPGGLVSPLCLLSGRG